MRIDYKLFNLLNLHWLHICFVYVYKYRCRPFGILKCKKKKKTNLENVIHFTGARNIVTVKWTHFKVDYISKGEYEWKTAGQFHIVGSYWLLHFIMCSAVRGAEPLFSPFHHTFTWHHYVLRSCMNNIPVSVICFWGNLGEKKKN